MIPPREAELGARWFGFRPEVAIQGAAVVIVGVCVLVAAVVDPTPLGTPAFAVSAAILVIATIFAFVIGRSDSSLLFVVPILDMFGLIVMQQASADHIHAIGYLAILPALWLGWSANKFLAGAAILLAIGLVEVPGGTGEDAVLNLELALRNVLLPSVVAVAAASTYVASRRTATSIRSLLQQEQATAAALAREKSTAELLDGILDAVDIGILAYDATGTQIIANRTVHEHPVVASTGLTSLELEQQGYMLQPDRVTPVPEGQGFISQALAGGEYRDRIVWISAPGTGQHALSASARPIFDANGELTATVIAVAHITAYVDALAAKDEFVGSVSHDFRTPLASIVGYLELLIDSPDVPDGIRTQLEVIERNTNRLQRLVSDLIEEATRERSSLQLSRERIDLSALCARVIATYAAAADTAGVRIVLNAPGPAPAVIDQRRMAQAIDNLLSTALRFTGHGGAIEVTVSTDDRRVQIDVWNSDVEMPPEEMEALASPFYRATGIGQEFPGVGLGLAITKGIIGAHRGTLVFGSAAGRGTTVTATLPVR